MYQLSRVCGKKVNAIRTVWVTSHHKPAADDLGVAWPGLGRCPTAPNFPLGLEFNNFDTDVHRVLMTPYDWIYKEKAQLGVISE